MPVVTIGLVENNSIPKQTQHWGLQLYPARIVRNILVQGIGIDGNLNAATEQLDCYDASEPDLSKRGKLCDGHNTHYIRNNGLTIRAATDVTVKDVSSIHAYSGGLTVEKECRRLLVDGFYTAQNRFDGFAGYETEDSVFKNMLLEKQPYSGISVDLGFENNTFDTIVARNNKDRGIYSVQDSHNTYRNITAINNGNQGMFIVGRDIASPVGGLTANPKYEQHSCDGNKLEGVKLINNNAEGIYLGENCQNLQLANTVITTPNSSIKCVVDHDNSSYSGQLSCSSAR